MPGTYTLSWNINGGGMYRGISIRSRVTYLQSLVVCTMLVLGVSHPRAATLSGVITTAPGPGSPVTRARVMLFDPPLATFVESRTDGLGRYRIDAPTGTYRLGVAALDFEYQETSVTLGSGPLQQDFVLATETHPGAWETIGDTSPETFGASNSGSLLADGTLFFCHDTQDPVRFNPVSRIKTFPADSHDPQGCAALTLLGTGELLFIGGQRSADFRDATTRVKSFNTFTGQWSIQPSLNQQRWYPGLARLSDGGLLVCGGGQSPNAQRTATCERWNPVTRNWTLTTSMSQPSEYSPMALLSTGEVLKTWFPPELYDPTAETWRPTGNQMQSRSGVYPDHCDHSLVVLRDGEVLIAGILPVPSVPNPVMGERYEPCTGTWRLAGIGVIARSRPEVVPLPDGRIFVAAGRLEQSAPNVYTNAEGYVRLADLYDPRSERWRPLAEMRVARQYHATTLLLPDGRVLTTAGVGDVASQSTDMGIDAFSPPYMFRGPRPRIDSLSASSFARGETFRIDVSFANPVTNVILIGAQATTHYVDGAVPRILALPFEQTGRRLEVKAPASPVTAPEGYYLLFVMVDDVPSPGKMVRLDAPAVAPSPDSIGSALRVTRIGNDVVLDWKTGPLNPSRYNVYRSPLAADLELTPQRIGTRAASDVSSEETWTDVGAANSSESIVFYRILGRKCDGLGQLP